MISAVIFDMDGTLLDTEKLNVRFWCEAGARFGFDIDPSDILFIRSLDGKLVSKFLEERYPGFDFGIVREERRRLMREHVETNGLELKPGVTEILDFLSGTDIKTAVASATAPVRVDSYLKMLGIHDRFDEIVCTSMAPVGKPAPDVYLYACDRIGVRPQDCLAVEDSPNGVMSASAAGCKVAFIPDLTPADDDIIRSGAREFDGLPSLKLCIERSLKM